MFERQCFDEHARCSANRVRRNPLGRSHRAGNWLPLAGSRQSAELLGRERDYGAGITACCGGLEYALSWLSELTAVVT
jgi:hypothetical protein